MTRTRFKEILQNLIFPTTQKMTEVMKVTKLDHWLPILTKAFFDVHQMTSQNLDEYMVKFQGQLSIKQYVESKLIKTVFKIFCRCVSKTGFSTNLIFTLERKKMRRKILEEVLFLPWKKPWKNVLHHFFNNFFNIPQLFAKLFDKGVYAFRNARKNRKCISKSY